MIVTLIILVVLADLYLFGGYIRVLTWHAWHGNHVEMNGLRFRVPLWYFEDHTDRTNQLNIDTFPVRFSSKAAFINIDFHRQPPAEPDSPQGERIRQQMGLGKSASHKVRLADREGMCVNYFRINSDKNAADPGGPSHIHCTFGEDLGATFAGTQDAVADFYAIIASAENVRGKQ